MEPPADGALLHARSVWDAAPFVRHLGATLDAAGGGRAESSVRLAPELLQQNGFAHAGVIATLADHTAAAAAVSAYDVPRGVLSIEFKVNLLKPAVGASLRCVSATLRAGRTIAVVESEVYAVSEGREALCAKATVTLAVVAPA